MVLSGKTRLAGVVGWPVSHSLSPRLHGHWLERYGIDGAYVPLPVAPEDVARVLPLLPRMGFAGVNVTVPHKEAALAAVDEVTETARRIGAVNTIVARSDGSLLGDNTDGYGFRQNLAHWHPDGRPAVVVGAGGAARAVCVALLDAGVVAIRLLNRTGARAEALAADMGGGAFTVLDWNHPDDALEGAGLLVNTTALGMAGQPPLDLPLDGLPGDALVTDIVYTPLETPLLAAARARGNPAVDGLGMLLHQARPGFAAWFGRDPDVDEALRQFVLAGLAP
ncbi:MAG: shikimate dehydrogenase [Hyphomicrobiales bacterium]|nr:shikimate dehydrogenase [Hyphomicrobiales bacterium]